MNATLEVRMTIETMLWAVLGLIALVGGAGLVACLWALVKAPKR
jgi:hypothetical protein